MMMKFFEHPICNAGRPTSAFACLASADITGLLYPGYDAILMMMKFFEQR